MKTSANIQQIQMSNHKLKDKKLLEGNESLSLYVPEHLRNTKNPTKVHDLQKDKTPSEPGHYCFKQQRRDGESMEGRPNLKSDLKI